MSPLDRRLLCRVVVAAGAAVMLIPVASRTQDRAPDRPSPSTPSPSTESQQSQASESHQTPVERGKYIVHHVAMCVYCHTPREEKSGALESARLLQGAPFPLASPFPDQQWAFMAPKLAGLPAGWSEDQLATFLATGKPPRGRPPKPPMPPFRMTKQDAQAVAAYLKTVQ